MSQIGGQLYEPALLPFARINLATPCTISQAFIIPCPIMIMTFALPYTLLGYTNLHSRPVARLRTRTLKLIIMF